jgi:YegS/Rv2252/BmrU family lipid kinase
MAVDDGADVVCAWGGDGTVNEVASGLLYGRGVLAIVPAGSGNGFARDLGIPLDKDAALAVAVHGVTRHVDVGEVNGHIFVGTAGVGFDAHVAHSFAKARHQSRGAAAYVVTGLREMFRYKARHCTVIADGAVVWSARAKLVTVANTRQWGNNACVAPFAKPDDGRIDLLVVPDRSTLVLALQAWRLWTGSIGEVGGVATGTYSDIVVTMDGELPMHIDGEPAGHTMRLAVSVRPKALAVRVPGRSQG